MKILHTSDWHLGQRFYDKERHEEHARFLDFLLQCIQREEIDLLLICGDLFDNANPSREAERLYYDFLRRLTGLGSCSTVIIGGNHDSAAHLEAPQQLLKALNIHVVGAMPENPEDALFYLKSPTRPAELGVWLAAIPYLRDRDLRKAVLGEEFSEREQRTREAIAATYQQLFDSLLQRSIGNAPLIATGHLTALGATLSDSERHIHIGNIGSISAERFPEGFDYIALGHLHRAQRVAGRENIRYSGSPIPLSFSEADHTKELRLLNLREGKIQQNSIEVPSFRLLLQLRGSSQALLTELSELDLNAEPLPPWLELIVDENELSNSTLTKLHTAAQRCGGEVLKVGLAREEQQPVTLQESDRTIEELKPEEVFQHRLTNYDGSVDHKSLQHCFSQLLDQLHESEA